MSKILNFLLSDSWKDYKEIELMESVKKFADKKAEEVEEDD